MKHIVMDIEMNKVKKNSEAGLICSNETIEIGAVMLDENFREISSFQVSVKPEYNDRIIPSITRLTGITTEMVSDAPRFNEAFRMFSDWCRSAGDAFKIYSWSDTDFNQISKEMILKQYDKNPSEEAMMAEPWSDFQKEFDTHLGFEKQLSLSTALEMADIDFAGRKHSALDDARNTAELLHICNDEELFNRTLRKIRDYMQPSECVFTLGGLIDLSTMQTA